MKKFIFLFLFLATFSTNANAFFGFLIGLLTAGGIASAITSAVISLAISAVVNHIFKPDDPESIGSAGDAPDQGVKQRIPTDPANKLPVVYGEKRLAGQVTMADISSNNQTLYFIISLCEGNVEGITKVYWEDKELSFASTLSSTLQNVTDAVNGDGVSDDFLSDGRMKVAVYPDGGCLYTDGIKQF